MRGVAGALTFHRPLEPGLLPRMLSRLAHRGPDGSGVYRDDRVELGHVRLAVIDVAGGAQPMGNAEGTVWVTFNGEIFNYVELRSELRALGHRFRTSSDTEVIVHAWEQWGEGAFDRFNGQWALAIWDTREGRLVLCRDRLGVRPLFWTQVEDRVLFASEVKALFADPAVRRSLDRVGLVETMTFWSPVAPRTAFEGVQQVPPGHVLELAGPAPGLRRYWQPEFPERGRERPQDLGQAVDLVRDRLVRAVQLRFLRSDVPVGGYLSGGIDSAITSAIIARYTDAPLTTFSLRFADRDFDEGGYQQEVVHHLGTEHHEVTVGAQDIAEAFVDMVRHAETPLLRAAPAPMLLLSRLVRKHGYKVVVTGEGADEVFAGYDIFREARLRGFLARNPSSPLRARALDLLYPWMARSPGQAPAFAREFFGRGLDVSDPAFSHRPRWETTATLLAMTTEELDLAGENVVTSLVASMPPDSVGWDPLARAQWLEMSTLLPGYILSSQGDRMLMASSVEGRFPFLDRDVLSLANELPARHKLLGLDEKHVLKLAFRDLLPERVLRRPKQPYRSPDAGAFFADGAAGGWVEELTSPDRVEAAGVFRPAAVAALMNKCRRSRGGRMSNTDNMRLVAVLSTQLVHRDLVEGDGSSSTDRLPAGPATLVDRSTRRMRGDRHVDDVRA